MPGERLLTAERAPTAGSGWSAGSDAPGPTPTHSSPVPGLPGPASLVWDLLAACGWVPGITHPLYPPSPIPVPVHPGTAPLDVTAGGDAVPVGHAHMAVLDPL